jgi:7-cyano-7-deazaguanine reductase
MASKKKLDNSNISKHLGQSSQYKSIYDPSLLVREPRQSNRTHLDIQDEDLPFVGNDTWNAYEVSGLTDHGLPVTGIAKIVYPCSSKYIVESKSIKLYFNSFNMTSLGKDANEVRNTIAIRAAEDLSKLLEADVKVKVFSNDVILKNVIDAYTEWGHDLVKHKNKAFITLEEEYPVDGVEFSVYSETPELLEVLDSEVEEVYYHSALLKSNCRVTSQPDWGDVYIYMKGKKTVDPISLLKYIVSFRDECHFHEEICETIYKRLHDLVKPEALGVKCLYARRGGIDINPERVSSVELLHTTLSDHNIPFAKTPKQ